MKVSKLSMSVAMEICAFSLIDLAKFKMESVGSAITPFTHYNFFYSYPEFGKTWKDGKSCEYHSIEPVCSVCGSSAERNFAGVGIMYIRNDVNKFTILCWEHACLYPMYKLPLPSKNKQLNLF